MRGRGRGMTMMMMRRRGRRNRSVSQNSPVHVLYLPVPSVAQAFSGRRHLDCRSRCTWPPVL